MKAVETFTLKNSIARWFICVVLNNSEVESIKRAAKKGKISIDGKHRRANVKFKLEQGGEADSLHMSLCE